MNRFFLLVLLAFIFSTPSFSKQRPPAKDPRVEQIVHAISGDNLRKLIDKLASFGTRHTLSDTTSPTRGIGAARRWIKSEFERYAKQSGGRMTVEYFDSVVPKSARIPAPTRIVDVVATLRPSHPESAGERVFIVSGHYDSRVTDIMNATSDAPGADDDGSGTAITMELARVMSKYDFNATIMFIAFAGEEQGLFGSEAFADAAKKQGMQIAGVLNNDIVGGTLAGNGSSEKHYVRLFSEAYGRPDTGTIFRTRNFFGLENDGASRELARSIKEIAEQYDKMFGVRLVYRLDRFARGGDQESFDNEGYPAVRFTEVSENYDHQHQDVRKENMKQFGDLPEFIDAAYLANVAKSNASALATLAFAPPPPSNVQMAANLGYTTTLRWMKSIDPTTAGYFIRYRETTSPAWQMQVFTTDTTITLRVSKDEYLFGIETVNREGNISQVSIPHPVRE